MRLRVEGMQYARVGLKAARDDRREHTGVKGREAVADPSRSLNLAAPLRPRLSHESIIHGPREHVCRAHTLRSSPPSYSPKVRISTPATERRCEGPRQCPPLPRLRESPVCLLPV